MPSFDPPRPRGKHGQRATNQSPDTRDDDVASVAVQPTPRALDAGSIPGIVIHSATCIQRRSTAGVECASLCQGGLSAPVQDRRGIMDIWGSLWPFFGHKSEGLARVVPCLALPSRRVALGCQEPDVNGDCPKLCLVTETEKRAWAPALYESMSVPRHGIGNDLQSQFVTQVEVYDLDKESYSVGVSALVDTGASHTYVAVREAEKRGWKRPETVASPGQTDRGGSAHHCVNGGQMEILGEWQMGLSFRQTDDWSILMNDIAYVVPDWTEDLPRIIIGQTILSRLSHLA